MPPTSTILIVDDSARDQEILRGLLPADAFTLVFVSEGRQAVTVAQSLAPDLILLDVMLPGLDGYEICRRLRAEPALAEVPVVMVTALSDRGSRLRGLAAGADDFISKPLDGAELLARASTITRLNRYRKLRAQAARLQWMAEAAPDGYVIVDDADQIQYANPQACRYLGLTASAGRFLAAAQSLYHCEPEAAWQGWPAAPETGHARYLVRAETAAAPAVWLQVARLNEPAGTGEHLLRVWEVTEQVTRQRDMRSFQRQVAHKLRTPLNISLLLVEAIVNEAAALPPFLAGMAGETLEVLRRFRQDVETVLSFARTYHLQSVGGCPARDLPALLARLGAELELGPIPLDSAPELAGVCLGLTEAALEQVLRELLTNARKFHPRQAPAVQARLTALPDGRAQLRLEDDGLTLAPTQLTEVWTPYYQGEKSFTGQVPGMGLGLPTVATIVWQAGGRCRLLNREPGPGVAAELVLPLWTEAGADPADALLAINSSAA